MYLKTVMLNGDDEQSTMMEKAKDLLDSLSRDGVTDFRRLESPPEFVHCQQLTDGSGRMFRYIRAYDVLSGFMRGRIDVAYEKSGG